MTQSPLTLISPDLDPGAVVREEAEPGAGIVLLLHGLGSHEGDLAGLIPLLPARFTYVSVRGIHRYGAGFAWLEHPLDPERPAALEASAQAVERWIAAQEAPVVGAIGFSQGGMLALQLLRRSPRALDFVVNLSGAPFPAPMPGDAALAEASPPVLWGHGGLDPLFDEDREEQVRRYLREHTQLSEVLRPALGHAVDEVEVEAIVRFLAELPGTDAPAGGAPA
ncbi:alpha/beta hydrolase [Brachybacterium sp. YJGR34]|uniref:alpha/beta hydrolase n=1 Tax=Brachybacterium sp. YJGR34 TaxID=2059911 RepID=UPI000E0A72CE|nr:dienelactone hydrolase family protein [Brachybacterium sp. YJGR34]